MKVPSPCKRLCIHHTICKWKWMHQFIEQLEDTDHLIGEKELENMCSDFVPDNTDSNEFIINIWGI